MYLAAAEHAPSSLCPSKARRRDKGSLGGCVRKTSQFRKVARRRPILENASAGAERQAKHQARALRVLWIDADRAASSYANRRRTAERSDVEIAIDGADGLVMACQHVSDVIVLEQRLPGMTGLDVLRALTAALTTRQHYSHASKRD